VTPHLIASVDELRSVVAPPNDAVLSKLGDELDAHARDFIAASPFLVMSTSSTDGRADASPKGDDPGFVLVEDEHTLVIPDRPGNNLAYGLVNIVENPHIGLLFVVPGTTETLRVNGRAELDRDPELLARLAARGKDAVLGIRVHVEEAFFHCGKAFIRSRLWKHQEWTDYRRVSFGQMYVDRHLPEGENGELVTMIDEAIELDYRENL
jgi:PPOX class probable FMN-dependent enzyme